jgi:hypothetical protein
MLSNISWQQYCFFLLIANCIYYLSLWIFYGAKLPVFASGYRVPSLHAEDQPDEVMTTAQHVIDELRPLFAGRENKNELLFALRNSLQKYNQWDEPGFRETIDEFINRESRSICSIRLGDDDFRVLWK